MFKFPNCLFSSLLFALLCPQLVHSNFMAPAFHMPYSGLEPVALNAAESLAPGAMQSILQQLNPTTHGSNHMGNFARKKRPQEEMAMAPEPPLPKVILIIWDRNGEILDDPHVQLRAVQEEHAVIKADMLPLAHMAPLIECAYDLRERPDEPCDYDLLIGSGVVDITLRKDRMTGKNRTGHIEISYAEKKHGPRISYIESIERLAIASDPGHSQHQEHHQKHMASANELEHRNILHLKYHPFEPYAYVYHIHGIVFWRGADFSKIDPMPIAAYDPFVHIEYFSDHEHVMSKLPYEMDLDPQTGEFRITIRNGFGLDKYREAEDKNYGKINIAVAVNKTLFRMRYYRVYTINVNECIKKSQQNENGVQHQLYTKDNPAQILYLWGDKEKMRFGQYPLKVNTHAFRVQIVRNGQAGGCEKPFTQFAQPQNWLELRDEDDELTLIHAANVQPLDPNTLLLHIGLQPNIAEGLHIRIDCGADASIHNIVIYQMESFTQLQSSGMVQLKPTQDTIAPHVTVASEQHNVHQAPRNPYSQMVHKRKHNGSDQIDAVLAEDENGGKQQMLRDDRCAPGLQRGRLAEECNSHLHKNGFDRLPEHVAHLGAGGYPEASPMAQIGQIPQMPGQFGQTPGAFAGAPSMPHLGSQTMPPFGGAPIPPMGQMPPSMASHPGQVPSMPPMGHPGQVPSMPPMGHPGQVPSMPPMGHPGQMPPMPSQPADQFGGHLGQGMPVEQPGFNQLLLPTEPAAHPSNLPPNRVAPMENSFLHNPPANHNPAHIFAPQQNQFPQFPPDPSMAHLQPPPQLQQNPLNPAASTMPATQAHLHQPMGGTAGPSSSLQPEPTLQHIPAQLTEMPPEMMVPHMAASPFGAVGMNAPQHSPQQLFPPSAAGGGEMPMPPHLAGAMYGAGQSGAMPGMEGMSHGATNPHSMMAQMHPAAHPGAHPPAANADQSMMENPFIAAHKQMGTLPMEHPAMGGNAAVGMPPPLPQMPHPTGSNAAAGGQPPHPQHHHHQMQPPPMQAIHRQ